jgi:RNA polymerase sigma factor (TIGR02999 family)
MIFYQTTSFCRILIKYMYNRTIERNGGERDMAEPGEVTQFLIDWSNGDEEALKELMPIVYKELRQLAENRLRHERFDNTLQATALVNEAFIRLVDCKNIDWKNRAHFFGVAAQLMRNILVDNARTHLADKRGGGMYRLSLGAAYQLQDKKDVDLIALDDALVSLAAIDQRQSRIIELRYFGGLTIEETAEVLGISPTTVKYEWTIARAWLLREISK